MVTIKVPATSANMGPGFDSLGVAVNVYLELTIIGESDQWIIEHDFPYLPTDERNMIIQIAKKVSHRLKPHHLVMKTEIPTTRGMGSSSSAIVAGIELANYLDQLNLSIEDKIQLATKFEGHPDNVVPCIIGHMAASVYDRQHVIWTKIKLHQIGLVALVPKTPLSTKVSRSVLPENLTLAQAAKASAISNVLVAQLSRGHYKQIKKLIERDKFHEPYRTELVPELLEVRRLLRFEKTYGTYLSGAGPTVMTLVPQYHQHYIYQLLKKQFPDYLVMSLQVDTQGAHIVNDDLKSIISEQ